VLLIFDLSGRSQELIAETLKSLKPYFKEVKFEDFSKPLKSYFNIVTTYNMLVLAFREELKFILPEDLLFEIELMDRLKENAIWTERILSRGRITRARRPFLSS